MERTMLTFEVGRTQGNPSLLSMRALYSSHIACFHLGSLRAWKGDLGMGEEVVTWKLYLGLAFTIPTLEHVTIWCCEVDGGGGGGGELFGGGVFGGGVFGGSVVFSGDGVGNRVRGVVCGVACGVVCGVVCGCLGQASNTHDDLKGTPRKIYVEMQVAYVWCGGKDVIVDRGRGEDIKTRCGKRGRVYGGGMGGIEGGEEMGGGMRSMSPPKRQRYRWNITFATGYRRMGKRKWTNRRIRVPAFMCSCRIKEELTLVKTLGKEVEEYVTKKKPKPYNLYGFVDLVENEQVYAKNGFAPHRIPQPEGNHNGWLSEEEESDSDSESTASNHPHAV
ncbi:hypothetical protein Tco_0841387 [Tanacetum coccineum]|uniref:Uncharacterized protein n=1 Tax=Tanacetum coccineum TaxID=301880 RepID=A0ABQ5AW78_9ASTR